MENLQGTTIEIPISEIKTFEKKFKSLSKKAAKVNTEISYEQISCREAKGDFGVITRFVTIELTGHVPAIEGYEFIAKADFIDDKYNMFRNSPWHGDVEIPAEFKTKRSCDHCKTDRKRKSTVILRHVESGEFIMVGRQCVKDFIGHDLHSLIVFEKAMDAFLDEESFRGGGGRGFFGFETLTLVAWTIRAIELFGYTTKAAARNNEGLESTASMVITSLNRWSKTPKKYLFNATKEDFDEAKKLIEWFRNEKTDFETTNNYIYNMSVIMKHDQVEYKNVGLVTSLPGCYNNDLRFKKEREEADVKKEASNWVGQPKDKIEAIVTVEKAVEFNNDWGGATLFVMKDEDGNILKWTTGGSVILCVGDVYKIKATVKRHTEWNSIKQTEILRVKVLQVISSEVCVEEK